MGWFDLITNAMGEKDPAEQIGQYADTQQAQNRRALGQDASGNPLPQGSQPDPSAAAASTGILSPDQEPNATKTPVSMGHMIMDLARSEQRRQGFDQAMGMGFAAFAQPRDRQMVSQMFNEQPLDAAKYGQTVMNAGSNQQGQDRTNMILRLVNDPSEQGQKQLAQLAASMNMDPAAIRAMANSDPASLGKLIATQGTPTPTMSNVMAIKTFGQNNGWSPQDIDEATHLIATGMLPPQVIPMQTAAIAFRRNHPGEKLPWDLNDPGSFERYQKEEGDFGTARTAALQGKSQNVSLFSDLQNRVEGLKSMPGMSSLMDDSSDTGQARRQAAQAILNMPDDSDWKIQLANLTALTPQERYFISEAKQLKGQQYAQAIQSLPNRFSQQEAAKLTESLGQIGNIGFFGPSQAVDPETGKPMVDAQGKPVMIKGSDAYKSQALNPLGENIKAFRANNIYSASGSMSDMPNDLRPYVAKDYLTGGRLHVQGQTEDWDKNLEAPADLVQRAAQLMKPKSKGGEGFSRSQADRYVRMNGFRPPLNGYGQ